MYISNFSKIVFEEILFFSLQLTSLLPDVIEINQDADGIIPEEIIIECEKRLKNNKPMPKVCQKIHSYTKSQN
jgi:hypothetical protein